MTTVTETILTPEQMIANARKAVATGKTTANMSEVEKLLAGREVSDTVNLSPVARVLAAREKEIAARSQNYLESDEFLQMKARELSRRLAIYSRIPGMQAAYAAAEQEGRELVQKIAARFQETNAELQAKQAELAEKRSVEPLFTADELLKRLEQGISGTEAPDAETEKAAEALLADLRGSNVNTSA